MRRLEAEAATEGPDAVRQFEALDGHFRKESERLEDERRPAADATLGTPLDDAARELGFDPDEIFER